MELAGDSQEYEILKRAAHRAASIPDAMTCEIGLRMGGGSKAIIDGLKSNKDFHQGQVHVAIDPYGQLYYPTPDGNPHLGNDYSNGMRDCCLSLLHSYALTSGVNLLYFPLADYDFFERFFDGVPVYEMGTRRLMNTYSLVHVDGVHTYESVWHASMFFQDKTVPGSIIVYDDCAWYDWKHMDRILQGTGWSILEQGCYRISYIKEKS
jgi:hypothetical protein